MSGAKRTELHNWRHSSAVKRSATGDPEGGGCGCYGGRGGQGGRGQVRGGHRIGRDLGRGKFESQVVAIIAKTVENEANKLTNALETVAAAASAVNGFSQAYHHMFLLLLKILLFLLLTRGSNKLLNI